MNPIFRIVCASIAALTLATSPLAYASGPTAKNPDSYQQQLQLIAENTTSIAQVAFYLQILGASEETVKAVTDDLYKRNGDKDAVTAHGEFRGKKFFFNGEDTGFELVSYQPFNVSYHGKLWAYDRTKPFETNYFSFAKFVNQASTKTDKALLQLLLPKAYADAPEKPDAKAEGLSVGVSGSFMTCLILFFAIVTAESWVPVAAIGAAAVGVGALVGYLAGYKPAKGKDLEQKQLVTKLIQSESKLSCNADVVELKFHSAVDSTTLQIHRREVPPVKIFDQSGEQVSNEQMSKAQQNAILQLTDKCKSHADAARIQKIWAQVKAANQRQQRSQSAKSGARS